MRVVFDQILDTADILIVDDEPDQAKLLQRMLESAGYKQIEVITDPRRVQARVARREPDLVLLDLNMPEMGGFEVLEQIQSTLAVDSYLPVIILTGIIDNPTMLRALLAGAKDFMTKPLDLMELAIRVRIRLETRFHIQALERKVAALSQH